MLSPLVGEKATKGFFGKTIDIFSIIVSYAGVATSLGLGVTQICGGLNYLFGIPNVSRTWFIIIVCITAVFLTSAITGIKRGIKFLSNVNTYLALTLLFLGFIEHLLGTVAFVKPSLGELTSTG